MNPSKKVTAPESTAKAPAAIGATEKQEDTTTENTAKEGPATAQPGAGPAGAAAQSDTSKRKAWVKRTPTQVILEQVKKQEEKVSQLEKELAKEKSELLKMRQAAEIFQAS